MESNRDRVVVRGLKDVAAAETQISFVDPYGKLYYYGYDIDDLVGRVSYEEVVYLMLYGEFPNQSVLSKFKSKLIHEMQIPDQVIDRLNSSSSKSHPMEVLRTEVSHLGEYDPDRGDNSISANERKAIRLVAKVPTVVAHLHRIRRNESVVTTDGEIGFAENFLGMFLGRDLDEMEGETMDRYMILHADHGLNASTFAARVTASTQSDMYSAITSAIGTLKGKLHGGASERVMRMLHQINDVDEVEAYIEGMIDDKKRIMGFGHRVYRTEDPRSKHIRERCEILCKREDREDLLKKSYEIEKVVREKKGIFPNIDFYAATVLDALGVPREFYTSFFASSRVLGWAAHVIEQYKDNILIRPTSKYIGDYGRRFIPIEERE